jgi:hypothetical protein
MATRKIKRFDEGGEAVDELEAANASQVAQDIAKAAESAGAEATGSAILDKMRDDANKKSVAKPKPTPKSAATATAKSATATATPTVKKVAYETPYDRRTRENRESAAKTTPKEERKPIPLKSTKSEGGNRFMGSTNFKSGGSVRSASSRADGCAVRGKTRA